MLQCAKTATLCPAFSVMPAAPSSSYHSCLTTRELRPAEGEG
ncbi:hypothetical protein APTSU1_000964500 [Apodemus speciosus]|uniref:Uncharacterized protein n=1 Tax=Apodemus speciosus TaxID=105296 RepID=A0ABQ0F5C9_APOSI